MPGANLGGSIKLEGESEYRAALRNINSELRLLSKEMEENGKSAENTSKQIELYNKKIEEQKKYIQDIENALEKAKKEYGENSKEVKDWQTKLNNAKSTLVSMQSELDNAQKGLDDFSDKFKQSAEKLKNVGETMTGLGKKLSGLSKGAAAAVAGVTAIGLKSAAAVDDLNTLSAVTGISIEELQKFAYASDRIDVSQETITSSLRKLITNMQSAQTTTGKQREVFNALGVAYEDANGNLRNNIDVFYEVIDALGKVENSTEADVLAMNLFGKSAQELNPLIKGGSEALKELGQEAENAGLILSQDMLNDMNELNDTVDKFKATLSADFNKLGANIAPVLTPVVEDMIAVLEKVVSKLSQLDTKTIETGLKVGLLAASLAASLAPVLITLGKTMTAVSQLIPLLVKLKTAAMALSASNAALLAITAALAILNAALANANDKLDESMVTNREVNKALAEQAQAYGEATKSIDDKVAAESAELDTTKELARRFEELATKTDRTAAEEAELSRVVEQLNQRFPDLKLSVDGATGSIENQVKAIDELVKAQERAMESTAALQRLEAAKTNLTGVESTRWSARNNVTAAMQALGEADRRALMSVITDYNNGRIDPNAVDRIQTELRKVGAEGINPEAIENFKRALMDAQLAENSYLQAADEVNAARDEYSKRLAAQGTVGTKKTTGGTGKASSVESLPDTVKEGLETWQYRYDAGIISTEQYIKELTRIRDTYFVEDSKAWREYNLKIINLQKTLGADAGAAVGTAAKAAAKSVTDSVNDEAENTIEALKKAYQNQQAASYNWISERVFRGDFGDFGTTQKESYERIYQRALENYKAGVISIDELAAEADKIKAAKLNDYNTEKQKMQNFIDDRNFYNDWDAVNTSEEKVLQQMLDNADRYYAEGILSYREYAEEVRQINRSIFSAQATEQETVMQAAQDRIQKQLDEKRAEIDAQISALNQQVSDLRSSYATQDRQKRLAELKDEIKDFQNAVTIRGQEHLKDLQDEQERLLREQAIEDLQRENNKIIEQLEAEYHAMEIEKTSLLTQIADNTAQAAQMSGMFESMGQTIAAAVSTGFKSVLNDNSVMNNYNTNNTTVTNTLTTAADVMAAFAPIVRALKG